LGTTSTAAFLYKLGRIDKFQPDHEAEALVFGTVIHRVLESYYRNRQNGITLSIKKIHDLYEKYWRENAEGRENIQYSEGKDFDTLLLQGESFSPPIITIISMTTDSKSQGSRKHSVLRSMVALYP
jgi:hypothetical protein